MSESSQKLLKDSLELQVRLTQALAEEFGDTQPVLFHVGNKVEKVGGDYTFVGTVVAVFSKLSGAVRYVVEDDRGILHIYSHKNLRARE